MKDKKTKNHKENWIGNIIRGFLLFMPLLAIGVTCAIYTFNMTAKNGVDIEYKYNSNEVNDSNDLKVDNTYAFTYDYQNYSATTPIVTATFIQIDFSQYYSTYNANEFFTLSVRQHSNGDYSLIIYRYDNVQIGEFFRNGQATINFTYRSLLNNSQVQYISETTLENQIKSVEQVDFNNVFYNSIDKVQQSPLFNWATDTAMYNVIHGACTTLAIESTFIPFLLAYWLLTYLIYIIYDIALLIVNMAHNRIHDVESSI